MEFGIDLQTVLETFPKGEKVQSKAPENKEGMKWTSQYGFVGATVFGSTIVTDGLNEEGLSFGALWLPTTEYQSIPTDKTETALDFTDMGSWILGNFATVDEVKEAVKKILVWGHPVPPLADTPPLHFAIHDAKGNNLVIEYIKGDLNLYENPNGVLTNFPTFDWQMTNLNNYTHLSASNAEPLKIKGLTLGGKFQGSGLLGIPGDWMPSSRFVRITTLKNFAKQPDKATNGVNLTAHLLNSVDIPLGDIRDKDSENGDYTQWIVIKDLTNKVFYFRSYNNLTLKSLDLKKLNLAAGSTKESLPIEEGVEYQDMTSSFQLGGKK